MKNKILKIFTTISFALLLITAVPALAAPNIGLEPGGLANQVADKSQYNPASVNQFTISESIGRVIRILLSLTGTVFLALTVYAGVLWMTAAGNDEKVEKSQGILRAAAIGLVIVIASYGISALVLAAITYSATSTGGAGPAGAGGGAPTQSGWSQYGGFLQDSAMRMLYLK